MNPVNLTKPGQTLPEAACAGSKGPQAFRVATKTIGTGRNCHPDCRCWHFQAPRGYTFYMIESVARIRIERQDLEPKIWRRIDVPLSTTLAALHDIIQVAFRWTDSHLHESVVSDRVYGVPSPEDEFYERKVYKAASISMRALIDRGVDRFLYVYDFGDHWRHDVDIEEIFKGDATTEYPAFVDGARCCPPEDVGGTDGFMEFLEAALNPGHEEHKRMIEWYGRPFDPADIDERRVRMVLGNFAARRRGPLASHRRGGGKRRA